MSDEVISLEEAIERARAALKDDAAVHGATREEWAALEQVVSALEYRLELERGEGSAGMTTSEMVERVAKALCASIEGNLPWERLPENNHEVFRSFARTAIAAMREPTPEAGEARRLRPGVKLAKDALYRAFEG